MKRLAIMSLCCLAALLLATTALAAGDHDEHWATCKNPTVCVYGGEPYAGNDIHHLDRCDAPGVCIYCDATFARDETDGEVHRGPFTYKYDETQHWEICAACGKDCFYDKHYSGCRAPEVCMDCGAPYPGELTYHGDNTHTERDAAYHWDVCDVCGGVAGQREAHVPSGSNPGVCQVCLGGIGVSLEGAVIGLDNPLGKLAVYRDGALVDYTGFARFEGADFYFTHGVIDQSLVGAVLIGDTWYAFDYGRLMRDDMIVPFQGGVFHFNNGTLSKSSNGLMFFQDIGGSGWFVFAGGQFQPGVNGPWLDPYTGTWRYLVNSRWEQVTDIVPFEGEKFLFREGYLDWSYTGYFTASDGVTYYVVNGMAQR